MLLVRLSGHSGAGKSRLTAALPPRGISCPRAVLYTSRLPRDEEVYGRDYYFLSRGVIETLPLEQFFVGPVREMLQAVDLSQLEIDLRGNNLVLIEIFHDLWHGLKAAITARLGHQLRTTSVFMTAVDPEILRALSDDQERATYIRQEVERILRWRRKDPADKVVSRTRSAVDEILGAIAPGHPYRRVFHSAPEGPTGEDDWTREPLPVGRAGKVLDEFVAFIKSEEIG